MSIQFRWEEHDDINPATLETFGIITTVKKWRCLVGDECYGAIVKQDGFNYRIGTRWVGGQEGLNADDLETAKSVIERNIKHNLEKP